MNAHPTGDGAVVDSRLVRGRISGAQRFYRIAIYGDLQPGFSVRMNAHPTGDGAIVGSGQVR